VRAWNFVQDNNIIWIAFHSGENDPASWGPSRFFKYNTSNGSFDKWVFKAREDPKKSPEMGPILKRLPQLARAMPKITINGKVFKIRNPTKTQPYSLWIIDEKTKKPLRIIPLVSLKWNKQTDFSVTPNGRYL